MKQLLLPFCIEREIWADIKGYEGKYQVSTIGRVKTLQRFVKNHKGSLQLKPEKIMKLYKHYYGYDKLTLSNDARKLGHYVHRLMAAAFIYNDKPEILTYINHKDGNPSNNHINNIEWCTQRQNSWHGKRTRKDGTRHIGFSKASYGGYQSIIKYKGTTHQLGCYRKIEDAQKAYNNFLIENNIDTSKYSPY